MKAGQGLKLANGQWALRNEVQAEVEKTGAVKRIE